MTNTKNIVITSVIALVISILIGIFFVGKVANQSNLIGSVRTVADQFPNGIQLGNETINTAEGVITLGANQAAWRNTTGSTIYVEDTQAFTLATSSSVTGAVATSSYRVMIGTSTASSISNFATPDAFNSSLLLWPIGTSKVSNSLTASSSRSFANGQNSNKLVSLPNNGYLIINIINGLTGAPATQCTQGGPCESATSTNRGFKLGWYVRYHY